MSLKKPDGEKKSRKRGRTIHLPSVDPDCYLVVPSLELGKYEDCPLHELCEPDNWGDLQQIVQPVADLVVKDFLLQHFVDEVRHRFDSTRYQYMSNSERPFIPNLMTSADDDGGAEVLKILLAVGLDPDLPETLELFRPSHLCGRLARVDFAGLIFPCRPFMKALDKEGNTPLKAAWGCRTYKEDRENPRRKILRKKVANYIMAGRFEVEFPSLAELVVEKSWFAVKNILRRQVVAKSEFTEKLQGKTAAEWAEFLKEPGIAEEIRYYAITTGQGDETVKKMTALVKKFCDTEDERSVLSSEVLKLEKKNEELRDETVAKDVKIAKLSKAVSVYRTRLEGAGIGWEPNKNSPKSDPEEEPKSSVDQGCDVGSVDAPDSSNGLTITK